MSTSTKFCANCKFSSKSGGIYYCEHPNNGANIVTGEIESRFASTVRNSEVRCGVFGRWYEPKKGDNSKISLWDKIRLVCRYKQGA